MDDGLIVAIIVLGVALVLSLLAAAFGADRFGLSAGVSLIPILSVGLR